MQKRNALRFFLIFVGIGLTVCAIAALSPLATNVKWVGTADLEVDFVIIDAETGQPIPDAMIYVREEQGVGKNRQINSFTIAGDGNGHAKRVSTDCMSFGSRGAFEDIFAIRPPSWRFFATAAEYANSDPEDLLDRSPPQPKKRSQRVRPHETITISVRLHKTDAQRPTQPTGGE